MERQSYIDELTGIYNRRYLEHWIEDELKRCERYDLPLSMALIDIDDFKQVNDTKGHLFGDEVLREFTDFLRKRLRASDVLIRYGGDEFLIILSNTPRKQARNVLERLFRKIEESKFNGVELEVSCGISSFEEANNWKSLFSIADERMYQSKKMDKESITSEKVRIEKLNIPTPELMGRSKELSICKKLIDNRTKKIMIMKGEAGIGKTRFAIEIIRSHTDRKLFTGGSYPALSQSPYYAVRELLNNIYSENEKKLVDIFTSEFNFTEKRIIARFIPSIAGSLSGFSGDRLMMFDTITRFLDCISRKIKFAVLFDDLHWASSSTIDMLYFILKSRKEWYPVLGTYRTEEIENTPFEEKIINLKEQSLYTDIMIDNLSRDETGEMMESIISGKINSEAVDFVYNESGGNPFFIEEILKESQVSGALTEDKNGYYLNKKIDIRIPQSIEDTILYKLSILDGETRNVLNTAAIVGGEFDFYLLKKLNDINEGELFDILDSLIDIRLIRESKKNRYTFKEDLFREVIINKMPTGTKRKLHGKIARIIEKEFDESQEKIERLAHHYYHSGEEDKIIKYAEKAGDNARTFYAHNEALKFYEWALSAITKDEHLSKLYRKMGEEAAIKGDYDKADAYFKSSIEFADDKDYKASIFKQLGEMYTDTGDYKKAVEYLRNARRIYKSEQKKLTCDPHISWIYMKQGKEKLAERKIERVIEKLNRKKYREEYSYALNAKATILLHRGEYDRSLKVYKEAKKIREDIGLRERVGSTYMNQATVYKRMNELKKATEYYEKALDIYRETGFKEGEIVTLSNLGSLEINRNNLDKAENYVWQALEMAEWVGGIESKVFLLRNLGFIMTLKGAMETSMDFYRQAEEYAKKGGSPENIFYIYVSMMNINILYLDSIEVAEKYMRKAKKMLDSIDNRQAKAYFSVARVSFYYNCDEIEKVIKIIKEEALSLTRKYGNEYNKFNLYLHWALAYSRKGWEKWGERYMDEAMKHAENTGDISSVAHVHKSGGKFWRNLGKYEKAETELKKALSIYKRIEIPFYIKEVSELLEEVKEKIN